MTPKAKDVDSVLHSKVEDAKTQRIELRKKTFCFCHEYFIIGDFTIFRCTTSEKETENPEHPAVPSDRAIASGPEYDTPFVCNVHPPADHSPHLSLLRTCLALLISVEPAWLRWATELANPGLNTGWLNWRSH